SQVPDLNRTITASADQSLTIRADRQTPNAMCVPREGTHFSALSQVPDLNLLITASTDQDPTIRADRQTPHRPYVTRQSMHFSALSQVPDLERLITACADQGLTIRADRQAPNLICVACKRVQKSELVHRERLNHWPLWGLLHLLFSRGQMLL